MLWINTDYNGTYLIIYTDSCSISLTKPWMLKLFGTIIKLYCC